jgi:hypothetical protein
MTYLPRILKKIFVIASSLLLQNPSFSQGNLVDFNSIPKSGTILVYAHMDDDLIWMLPFWKITDKFIGGAMPETPVFRTIVQQQQVVLDNHGYNIDYASNWYTPWGTITHEQYDYYYWQNYPDYRYLNEEYLTAFWSLENLPQTRTEINRIKSKIEQFIASPDVSRIITHNNWGEYGHTHHIALNTAVRELAVKYGKDVWMLGCNNGDFIDVDVPDGITYTMAAYDDPDLYRDIMNVYKNNSCWTWGNIIPSGEHKYIKIVDAGVDKTTILTGKTVTVTGPPQDEPGAYIFDGVDDFMTMEGTSSGSFTVSMRIKPNVIKAMDISKMNEFPLSGTYDRTFQLLADGRVMAGINDGSSRTITSSSALTANEWTPIAMTGDGTNLKIYVNGLLEKTISTGTAITSYISPELVLGQQTITSSFFSGQISNVKVYDRALDASEIGSISGMYCSIESTAGSGGTINPNGKSLVHATGSLTYNISPLVGYTIDDVIVDGNSAGNVSSYTFGNVTTNHTIYASFSGKTFTLTTISGENGSISPEGPLEVGYGAQQTMSIIPDEGYKIDWVKVDGVSVETSNTYTFNNITANHKISASFSPRTAFSIEATAGTGGTINPSGTHTVYEQDDQTYKIIPESGYIVLDVLIDHVSIGAVSGYTFKNVNSNHFIAASFKPVPAFTITSGAGTGGSVIPEGVNYIYEGSDTVFTIIPNLGYRVRNVIIDGVSVGAVLQYSFLNVTSNHSVQVEFESIPTYTITQECTSGGSISPDEIITLNEGSEQTFRFTPNDECRIVDIMVDGISKGKITSYTFTNIRSSHSIKAIFEPIPTYLIISEAEEGGSISPSGALRLIEGDGQSYIITTKTGYYLSDVLVNGKSVGPVTTYSFENVRENQTISALFRIYTYTINNSSGSGGNILPIGTQTVNYGSDITFTISPDEAYYTTNIIIDGTSKGAINEFTFEHVIANHSISATFQPKVFFISAGAETGGTIDPSGDFAMGYGSSKTFAIGASYGFKLKDVKVDNVSIGIVTSYTFSNIKAYHSISAEFEPEKYTITGTAGPNGTISPSGPVIVNHGSGKLYTFTANPGYQVSDVLVDNVSVGAVSSYIFADITTNHTISVAFVRARYSLTASAGAGGTISPTGITTLEAGSNCSYTITPNTGFKITDVLVDNLSVGALSTYTFSNLLTNHTISATFSPITYTITSSTATGGTISQPGNISVNYGSSLTLTITCDPGYQIAGVLVDNVSAGNVSSYTFSNITSNHSISASFKKIRYKISGSAGGGGSISPADTVSLYYGGSQTFTIYPAENYKISDVQVDNRSVGAVSSYKFENVSGNHTISATFSYITYLVDGSSGIGGSISPQGAVSVNKATDKTFYIIPERGYQILDVLVDQLSIGAVTEYTFLNISADHDISATFTPIIYTITASADAGGSISPEGLSSLLYGNNLTYTITPDMGFRIEDVKVDNVSIGSAAEYTFHNIIASHEIKVTFAKLKKYVIKTSAGFGGTITHLGNDTVLQGSEQRYLIESNQGYRIQSLLVDQQPKNTIISEYVFQNIDSDHTIVATFSTDLSVKMYPNPFKNKFTLEILSPYTLSYEIKIINMEQKVIYECSDIPGNTEYPIKTSFFAPGIYVLQVLHKGKPISSYKIIKY